MWGRTDLGTETLKTTWSSRGSSSGSETTDGLRLRFQSGRAYDFVTRRGSLDMGRGSGIRTHSWSKRTLGDGGALSDCSVNGFAVARETKEGERGRRAAMMDVEERGER